MEKIAIFNYQCPNCGKDIDNIRLSLKAPCRRDLKVDDNILKEWYEKLELEEYIKKVYKELERERKVEKYKEIYEITKKVKEFNEFFKLAIGSKPWSAQLTWFIRAIRNISFSITAPTGMGKTTFGIVLSIYFAKNGLKSYIVLPTRVLVEQCLERANKYLENLGIKDIEVLAYTKHSNKIKRKIEEEKYDILITSNQFLARNFDKILKDKRFDLVFVDDVDALLKASKNIDRTLKLIGFKDEDISVAWDLIKLKMQIAKLLRHNRKEEAEKLRDRLNELKEKIDKIKRKKHGVLILSSATGRARGIRVKLYRELLDFEIGSAKTTIRNIIDIYKVPEKDIKEELYELCKILKDGILIFVTTDQGSEFAKEIAEYLKSKGINCEVALAGKTNVIKDFAEGKINVLVGVAHYYGTIVRGLDLPSRVKYAIFTGVPRFRFNIKEKETDPRKIVMLLRTISDFVDEKEEYNKLLRQIYDNLSKISPLVLNEIKKAIEENRKLENYLGYVQNLILEAREKVHEALNNKKVLERIEKYPYLSLEKKGEDIYLLIPDVKTYIQASGRTSRLYAGGVTKGVSIILVDDEKLLRGLMQKMKWLFD